MARLTPLWMQAGEYPAATDRRLIGAIWPAGGVVGGALSAPGNTRIVNVAACKVAVPQADGSAYLCVATTAEGVAIPPADQSGSNRNYLIVVRVREGTDTDFIFDTVQGQVSSGVPTVPATPAGTVRLGYVYVAGGTAFVTQANITDTRPPSSFANAFCSLYRGSGYNFPSAGGLISVPWDTVEVDTFGMADLANNGMILPVPGLYHVSHQVAVAGGANLNQTMVDVPGTDGIQAGWGVGTGQFLLLGGGYLYVPAAPTTLRTRAQVSVANTALNFPRHLTRLGVRYMGPV